VIFLFNILPLLFGLIGLHCQQTGEKFIARTARKTKRMDDDENEPSASKKKSRCDKMWAPDDGEGEDDGDVSDTYSDLYPGTCVSLM